MFVKSIAMTDKSAVVSGCDVDANGLRYGLVKADHYRPIKEQNFNQPLLTIPLVSVSFLGVGGTKLK